MISNFKLFHKATTKLNESKGLRGTVTVNGHQNSCFRIDNFSDSVKYSRNF